MVAVSAFRQASGNGESTKKFAFLNQFNFLLIVQEICSFDDEVGISFSFLLK
jgi:hypothetical protein